MEPDECLRAEHVYQTLTWKGLGQLASVNTTVALPGGSTGLVAYGYDGWGRRVRRALTRGGVTTTTGYLHAGDHVVAELSVVGNNGRIWTAFPIR